MPLGVGSAHGRFQPFHNGHLEYICASLAQAEHLYIGITQYQSDRLVVVDTPDAVHRGERYNNPLTYFERVITVQAALDAAGVGRDRYTTMPFPVEEPDALSQFLPPQVPIYTTIYDEWNRQKVRRLSEAGYDVRVLWERTHKAVVGHEIRDLMRCKDARWKTCVPAATTSLLESFNIASRLRSLALEGHL